MAACAADSNKQFLDTSFYGDRAVYWRTFLDYDLDADMTAFVEKLDSGSIEWLRWSSTLPLNKLMDNGPVYEDAV